MYPVKYKHGLVYIFITSGLVVVMYPIFRGCVTGTVPWYKFISASEKILHDN